MSLTRIGLLGGMSWESTAVYYRTLNQLVHERVGGHASAPLVLWSAEFSQIEAQHRAGDWAGQGRTLATAALALERAGAAAIGLAANTPHLVAGDITAAIGVPFVDLIDVVGAAVAGAGLTTVGLLATDYTMTSDLYPKRLAPLGVEVVVPEAADRAAIHRIIYEELLHGVIRDQSRATYLAVIDRLVDRGAGGIILGCTEIGLLLSPHDTDVALFDTTQLHCTALADVIINGVPDTTSERT